MDRDRYSYEYEYSYDGSRTVRYMTIFLELAQLLVVGRSPAQYRAQYRVQYRYCTVAGTRTVSSYRFADLRVLYYRTSTRTRNRTPFCSYILVEVQYPLTLLYEYCTVQYSYNYEVRVYTSTVLVRAL